MNRLSVTVIDVLGLLVPGVVLLFGLCLAPLPSQSYEPLNQALLARIPLLANIWVAGACWVAAAYVLGFLLRLTSISLMNRLTWKRWSSDLQAEAKEIDEVFKAALNNDALSQGLHRLAERCGERDPGRYAPYFHFAKRIVRGNPEYWSEAERLEAEVRFAAGLFVPFALLALDGLLRFTFSREFLPGLLLLAVGITGATFIRRTFKTRRTKEVLYDQFLALSILLYPPSKSAKSNLQA